MVMGVILGAVTAAGCGADPGPAAQLQRELTDAQVRARRLTERGKARTQEIRQLEASLQGARDAVKSETERANRLAQQLGAVEMELSDAVLLLNDLRLEIARTRAALAEAQTTAEREAYARIKKELEAKRAVVRQEMDAHEVTRKANEAAWTVALQKIVPGVQALVNDTADYTPYVAGFGFATDRPVFNVRAHPAFWTHDPAVVEAAMARLRTALIAIVQAGLAFARSQGHTPAFSEEPVLRFYNPNAPDPDDTIGKLVAEWRDGTLTWK